LLLDEGNILSRAIQHKARPVSIGEEKAGIRLANPGPEFDEDLAFYRDIRRDAR